jgi:hypothetical protein
LSYSNENQTAGVKTVGVGQANGSCGVLGVLLFRTNASLLSNMKPLLPIYLGVATTIDGGTRFAPVGQIPDVYRVSMKGFSPGQVITIGGVDYAVFPQVNSDVINTAANEQYSGYEGFAYRITP